MNSLPDSVPYNIKVSFFEYQRREWEKVLESSKNKSNPEEHQDVEHWVNVNNYALEKINEIDRQLEALKHSFDTNSTAANVQPVRQ